MITWLQTRFQTGYKILFLVILAIVIVAFVFTVGDAPSLGMAPPRGEPMEYFGYDLRSDRDIRELRTLAEISIFLNYGQQVQSADQLSEHAFERLAYLAMARDLKLPEPNDEQLSQFLRTRPPFRGQTGQFEYERYADYLDMMQVHPRIDEALFARALAEDYLIEKARELFGGPGYALPHEVKNELAREQTEWTIEVASFPIESLDTEIDPSEDDLMRFYEENAFRYEIPDRKAVSYVTFESERFLDRVEPPSEEELREYYIANRAEFEPDPVNGPEEEEPDEVAFEDVRDEIEARLKQPRARRSAETAASDFTFTLFEQQVAMGSEALDALIDEHELPRGELAPYAAGETPEGAPFSPQVLDGLHRIEADNRFFSDPQPVDDGFVIFLLDEVIPSEIPPFEEVAEDVRRDFIAEEQRRHRAERGNELYATLMQRLEDGESFADLAEGLEMDLARYEGFTIGNPPEDLPAGLIPSLRELRTGGVSRMLHQNAQARFIHVVSREVPEIDTTDETFAQRLQDTRNRSAYIGGMLTIEEIKQHNMPATQQPVAQ